MLAVGRIYYGEMFYLPSAPLGKEGRAIPPSPLFLRGVFPLPLWRFSTSLERLLNPKWIQTGEKRALPLPHTFFCFVFLPLFPLFCLCLGSQHHTSILSSTYVPPLPPPVLPTRHHDMRGLYWRWYLFLFLVADLWLPSTFSSISL